MDRRGDSFVNRLRWGLAANPAEQLGDRVRHLHQALDLTFPEFTRYVRGLDTELATAILSRYPTTAALRQVSSEETGDALF
jgi:hypothetical protein